MELEFAIQELLSRLEFVSLPSLGSFVKRYEPASLSADGRSFNPPREFFIFDTKRDFNDEVLEGFVAETSDLDYPKAAEVVAAFVERVRAALEANAEVAFPGIGVLRRDSGGCIELDQPDEVISQTFGLGSVDLTPLAVETKKVEAPAAPTSPAAASGKPKPEEKPHGAKSIPTPRLRQEKVQVQEKRPRGVLVPLLLVLVIAAVAAALLLVPELRFWERLPLIAGSGEVQAAPETDPLPTPQDEPAQVPFETDSEADLSGANGAAQPVEAPVIAPTDKKSALYYRETVAPESKTFYIVVGSFAQESNAQKLIQELLAKGYRPILLQTDNMYRVAVYKFTSRDRALRELERLKAQKLTGKVWLLSM